MSTRFLRPSPKLASLPLHTWLGIVICLLVTTSAFSKPPKTPPPTIHFHRDVVYSKQDNQPLHLDLSIPKSLAPDTKAPAILLIHGGGWIRGDKSDMHPVQFQLSNVGIICASVQYRFAPKHQFPAQIDDAKNALQWLRENAEKYQINPDRIAVVGASAGAHLALLLAVGEETSKQICAAVGIAGPYDLVRGYHNSPNQNPKEGEAVRQLLHALIGGPPDQHSDAYLAASPITYLSNDRKFPPILLVHGEQDPLVIVEQSDLMEAKLKSINAPVEYLRIPDATHSTFGKDQNKHIQRIIAFLAFHLQS